MSGLRSQMKKSRMRMKLFHVRLIAISQSTYVMTMNGLFIVSKVPLTINLCRYF